MPALNSRSPCSAHTLDAQCTLLPVSHQFANMAALFALGHSLQAAAGLRARPAAARTSVVANVAAPESVGALHSHSMIIVYGPSAARMRLPSCSGCMLCQALTGPSTASCTWHHRTGARLCIVDYTFCMLVTCAAVLVPHPRRSFSSAMTTLQQHRPPIAAS